MRQGEPTLKYLPVLLVVAALTVAGLAVAGIAAAAKDITPIPVSNVAMTIDGSSGVTPKALSRSRYTPVALTARGQVRAFDGTPPPLLKEVLLHAQNSAVDVRGLPVCTGGGRDIRDPGALEAACKSAVVGVGSIVVSTQFDGYPAIPARILGRIYNGGVEAGTTTLYIHAYLTQPITTAIVTTVKVRKAGSGIRAAVAVPKIANGAGSVTDFSLRIDRKFTYEGKKVSVLSAKCVGGKLQTSLKALFYDSSESFSATILRTCTSKS